MGESYVELMWRVVEGETLIAAFLNLDDAREFASIRGGCRVFVMIHQEVTE